jgi:O-antigen ligase/polysaccharide polymerase Wzy-like membrane protein
VRLPRPGFPRPGPGAVVAALVAAGLFWIAYDNGSYSLASRGTVAIAVWWGFIVILAFGLWPPTPVPRAALLIGGLIAALALWTLTSLLWTSNAEATFDEFNRASLYLGTFIVVVLLSRRSNLGRFADGLALAVTGVAAVALISRLFPGSFPEGDLPTFLPGTVTRLSFPLGYWNGLAIFLALGVPLLLRLALVADSTLVRGLALAPMPMIAATVYLTSSRGGVATALVGSVVFLVLTERRWAAAAAIGASLVGAAVAIGVLLARDALVNGPLGTDLVEREGRSAALLIALACVVTGVAYGLGVHLLEGRIGLREPVGRIVVVSVLVLALVGVVASDPAARVVGFKALPGADITASDGGFVKAHLLSGGGSGRWQFWSAALDQWETHRILGAGAGTYESWWAQHASFSYFVRDAHSLYLEAIGELGIVGFLLIVAVVVSGIAIGARRSWHLPGEAGVTTSALTAVFVAYAVSLGFEWMWELTAVSVFGVAALALATGPATAPRPEPRIAVAPTPTRPAKAGFGLGIAALAVAWVLICAQAIPVLANREIARSQSAVGRSDLASALKHANAARDIQPWAASPYVQLALVNEEAGALVSARERINEAIDRDRLNWRLWLVLARVETKLGYPRAAADSLRRAVELNPRSPLFQGLLDENGRG